VIETLDTWGVTHSGLFTFAQSPKHIGLYQKFGFRPRSLTLVLEKAVQAIDLPPGGFSMYSQLDEHQRSRALSECKHLADRIYPGLDPTPEIESIENQSLGETVLLADTDLLGFAACHSGRGSEGGSGAWYLKFGAVAPGRRAREQFRSLLRACESCASSAGAIRMVAGVNAARAEAYEEMLAAGFRISLTGISMHRPNEPGFSRPGAFVIDDWR